jgi:hypothetical protein
MANTTASRAELREAIRLFLLDCKFRNLTEEMRVFMLRSFLTTASAQQKKRVDGMYRQLAAAKPRFHLHRAHGRSEF